MYTAEQLALMLDDWGAFRWKEPGTHGFALKINKTDSSLPLSPFKINLRTQKGGGPLEQSSIGTLSRFLYNVAMSRGIRFDRIAGVPNAGTGLATAFVQRMVSSIRPNSIQILLQKSVEAGEENMNLVSGTITPGGTTALIVDDVLTGATSKQRVITTLAGLGVTVTDVLVVVDREQGGADVLRNQDIRVHSCLTVTNLLECLVKHGRLSNNQQQEALDYIARVRVA